MTAWILVMWMGVRVIVPGIESQQECLRLADELNLNARSTWAAHTRCVEYRMAAPR